MRYGSGTIPLPLLILEHMFSIFDHISKFINPANHDKMTTFLTTLLTTFSLTGDDKVL